MFSSLVCHPRSVNISVFGNITRALSFQHEKRSVNNVFKVILFLNADQSVLKDDSFTRPPSCSVPPMIHCSRHQTKWVSLLRWFAGLCAVFRNKLFKSLQDSPWETRAAHEGTEIRCWSLSVCGTHLSLSTHMSLCLCQCHPASCQSSPWRHRCDCLSDL